MKKILFAFITTLHKGVLIYLVAFCTLANDVIKIDFRQRPPDLFKEEGIIQGPIVDLTNTLLDKYNLSVKWAEAPWPRTLHDSESGKVDLLLRVSMNKHRSEFLMPILIGYEEREIHFLVSNQLAGKISKMSEIKNLRLGLLRHSFYSEKVETLSLNNNVVYTNEMSKLLQLLDRDRVDVVPVYGEYYNDLERLHNHKIIEASFIEKFTHARYLAIPKESFAVKYYHQMNCDMYHLRTNGTVTKLYENYGAMPYLQLLDSKESLLQKESCIATNL